MTTTDPAHLNGAASLEPTTVPTTTAAGSLWLESEPSTARPPLSGELDVDVAVIGGGIAGATTAYLLKRDGARVALLEARQVGSGVTGANTGKATALQATMLSTVRRHHGAEGASAYAGASRDGVELIARLAGELGIECGLGRRDAFTYAADESELGAVQSEIEAATEAGLPVDFVTSLDLPYPVAGAARLRDQIEFHPVRYVRGLADAVDGDGSVVLEGSRVTSVGFGNPIAVRTAGGTVRARQVVVATHYPMLDRGLYFARVEAKRSYCLAARIRGELPQGMSISAGRQTRSIRPYRDLLVLGGEGHSVGSPAASPERFAALEAFAREQWDVAEITHRWSAQDEIPYDHLPMIGRYDPVESRVFVATGFLKWGLTTGSVAGQLLADLIGGRENGYARHFTPNRLSPRSTPKLAQMQAKVSVDLVGDRLRPAATNDATAIPRGEARVVRDGLGKTGVYVDEEGVAHAVSLRCTHLGCLLRWNGAERSWDCPCHASRFDVDGEVLEGPAVKPLERRDVPR